MKFLCLICAERTMEQLPAPDAERHFEDYREFTDAIRKSGHFVGCNRLLPPAKAVTVRVRQGNVSTTDGPYAEIDVRPIAEDAPTLRALGLV